MSARVIVDGDWGGDEMQLLAVLLAHPEQAEVLAATAVFGNASLDHVTRNACDILFLLGGKNIPVFAGATGPSTGKALEGDGAHGANGIGGVELPPAPRGPAPGAAADVLLDLLRTHPAGSITITATGPLTNLALALRRDPLTLARAKRILVMGGCTAPLPARDFPVRFGNITPEAEFNFYMAAKDAHDVLNSGIDIVLLPMNATHQLTLTPAREAALRKRLVASPSLEKVVAMMRAPFALDRDKFGIAPTLHDVHTALWILHPEAYEGRRGRVDVVGLEDRTRIGHTTFHEDAGGRVMVIETVRAPDMLFGVLMESLATCLKV